MDVNVNGDTGKGGLHIQTLDLDLVLRGRPLCWDGDAGWGRVREGPEGVDEVVGRS